MDVITSLLGNININSIISFVNGFLEVFGFFTNILYKIIFI